MSEVEEQKGVRVKLKPPTLTSACLLYSSVIKDLIVDSLKYFVRLQKLELCFAETLQCKTARLES